MLRRWNFFGSSLLAQKQLSYSSRITPKCTKTQDGRKEARVSCSGSQEGMEADERQTIEVIVFKSDPKPTT